MLKSITIVLGTILASMLMFQIAANTASIMQFWETGDPASSRTLWFGVVAVGLLIGGSILVLHKARVASISFAACLPLLIIYEHDYNQNYLSTPMDESIANWIGLGIAVVAVMAWLSDVQARETS